MTDFSWSIDDIEDKISYNGTQLKLLPYIGKNWLTFFSTLPLSTLMKNQLIELKIDKLKNANLIFGIMKEDAKGKEHLPVGKLHGSIGYSMNGGRVWHNGDSIETEEFKYSAGDTVACSIHHIDHGNRNLIVCCFYKNGVYTDSARILSDGIYYPTISVWCEDHDSNDENKEVALEVTPALNPTEPLFEASGIPCTFVP